MFQNSQALAMSCLVSLAMIHTPVLVAQQLSQSPIEKFFDEETLLVATVSLDEEAGLPAIAAGLAQLGLDFESVSQTISAMRSAGVERLSLLLGVPDLKTNHGPVVLVESRAGADLQAVASSVRPVSQLLQRIAGKNSRLNSLSIDNLQLLGTLPSSKRYAALYAHSRPLDREGLAEPLRTLLAARGAGVLVCPGGDVRRVLSELWPSLKAPWDDVNGALVGEGLANLQAHLGVDSDSSKSLSLRVTATANNEDAAERLESIASRGVATLADLATAQNSEWAPLAFSATQVLRPEREGLKVTVSAEQSNAVLQKILSDITPAMSARMREEFFVRHRMHQMKQLGLAMLNFESANRAIPISDAIRSPRGKPLLSWRVLVLPYLEEQELYNKFHLDEPWDSPHNKQLLREMPAVFRDPELVGSSSHSTRYLLPVGLGTTSPPGRPTVHLRKRELPIAQGTEYKQITDGTSNTILVVEVGADHAVPWTKPADWKVDKANFLEALQQQGRRAFVTAWADGHAKAVSLDITEQELQKALTISGGETLDRRKW